MGLEHVGQFAAQPRLMTVVRKRWHDVDVKCLVTGVVAHTSNVSIE
jgi:hypothetical protein